MTTGRPSTQWCTPSGRCEWAFLDLGTPGQGAIQPPSTADAMLASLRESIGRGYWKLAIRRYLMMCARGFEVPRRETQRCRTFIARCPAADLLKIHRCVAAWARMVGDLPERRPLEIQRPT